ncbi:MAG: energy transducer TonB [Bacteroidales bacterium]|nr:energy transducer TonB [Bacteroidales bacterium]
MKTRILLILFLILLPCGLINAQEPDEIVTVCLKDAKKPRFDGQDGQAFCKWIREHQRYPRKAKKAGIEGKVIISFKITAEGKLTDVKLRKGVHPLLDKEAVRVVKSAPQKWEPGEKTKGVPVDVTYTMPVVFTLPDKK